MAKLANLNTSPLIAQLQNQELLVEQGGADLFATCINHLVQHEKASELIDARANLSSQDEEFWADDWRADYRPYVVIEGVLQIPVMGVLLSQFPWQLGRWATGYKYIEMAFRRGLEDPQVKGFALICHSPGGEVTECFELTDKIYEWRDQKPVRAFVANYAYSACFSIASAAGPNNIIITRSGGAGSVGVVTAHVEFSKYLEDVGIKVTFIFAGDHKVDGNPYEKLSASAKKRIQARIDKIYGVFTSTVARNRDMEEEAVRDTKALTYDAEEAIEVGFADRIGALEEELVVYTTELADNGDEFMATQGNVTGQKPEGQNAEQGYTKAQLDAAIAEAKAEGHAEGVKAEQARQSEIRALEEGKDKPMAVQMVIDLGASTEAAKAQLSKMPVEVAAKTEPQKTEGKNGAGDKAQRNPFEEAMNTTDNPNVSANAGTGGETGDKAADQTNELLTNYARAQGKEHKAKTAA
jgi:signal peptide peptidase SppA